MGQRSVKKGYYVDFKLLDRVNSLKQAGKDVVIKSSARSTTIVPDFIGALILLHDGRKNVPIRITPEMLGHKLGEFAPTRKFTGHSGNKKAKKV